MNYIKEITRLMVAVGNNQAGGNIETTANIGPRMARFLREFPQHRVNVHLSNEILKSKKSGEMGRAFGIDALFTSLRQLSEDIQKYEDGLIGEGTT